MLKHWRVFDVATQPAIAQNAQEAFEIITKVTKRVTSSDRSEYYIEFLLKNISAKRVDDFRVDIEFPLDVMNLNTGHWLEVREKRTTTHMLFRKSHPDLEQRQTLPLYSGDQAMLMSFDYFVTSELFHKGVLEKEIRVTIYSGDMPPQVKIIPLKKITDF